MYGENVGLNRPKLELKRKDASINLPVNPTILNPDTGIIGRLVKFLIIDRGDAKDTYLPDSRSACKEAEIRKDFFVGTAMTYVRREK